MPWLWSAYPSRYGLVRYEYFLPFLPEQIHNPDSGDN